MNKLKEKPHMIISLDAEKVFDKNPTLLHDKSLGEIRDTRDISIKRLRNESENQHPLQ